MDRTFPRRALCAIALAAGTLLGTTSSAQTLFSVDAISPSVPAVLPADVLGPGFVGGPPAVFIPWVGPAAAEGNAGTLGAPVVGAVVFFSVDRFSVGIPGAAPDVASEAAAGQAAGDVYISAMLGANSLFINQDALGELPAIPAGVAAPPLIDDLDGLDLTPIGPLPLGAAILATLDAASAAAFFGLSGADVADYTPAIPLVVFPAPVLGLVPADDIDALHFDPGPGDVYFSLVPGSPSLGAVPNLACPFVGACSPADIFIAPGGVGPFFVSVPAAALGLLPGDNVDALAWVAPAADADADTIPDAVDNCAVVPNPLQCDTNVDGFGNACDADYDDSGVIGIVPDFLIFSANFPLIVVPPAIPDVDSNCDGIVGLVPDFAAFLAGFAAGVPGPSLLPCAGVIPCR
jgi:hypothetical protein